MLAVSSTLLAQLNMTQLSFLPYSQDLSDVWGYVDEQGNEYALVGVYNGLSIVDVTDPTAPAEVFFGPGENSIWRDIKTWGNYAYVSNETGGGVYIVDLSPLPDGDITNTIKFTGTTYPFQTIHNLYIDESGKLYIFGSNNGSGGAIICDLTQDPMNPVELGRFNQYYLHDGMARGDTLWGAAIYEGVLAAIDVSDPSAPQVMGTVSTPGFFTHNAWVSDNGSHVFTTDEISSGYIGAYNVTDVTNMYETDRIQSNSGSGVIPHNVHVKDDFLVTAYYADGIVVHDAKYPDKLIEVANFDTSPNYSGNGYHGSWGAYPFLPSGNILASDIEMGLYVLGINYIRAAYLEGTVRDASTSAPLFNVLVEIPAAGLSTQTAFDGSYFFGSTISGTYDVEFSKAGYTDKTVPGVEIVNGEIAQLDVDLETVSTGLGEERESILSMNAYPNPFSGTFTIDARLPGGEGLYTLNIMSSTGALVYSSDLTEGDIKKTLGQELPAGLYMISLRLNGVPVMTEKVVKR